MIVCCRDFCITDTSGCLVCQLDGLPSRLLSWNAYAGDIADKCTDEITATSVTAQSEAALSAFVGLLLNTGKTESMGCRLMAPVTLDATKAKNSACLLTTTTTRLGATLSVDERK